MGRIKAIEGLRGLSILLVFLTHLFTTFVFTQTTDLVAQMGNAGVDIFFMISGFLLYGQFMTRSRTSASEFLARRFWRIYPAYTAVFALYLVLALLFPHGKIPADTWERTLFFLQSYALLPGIFNLPGLITVAWSLSYEFAFYLALPGLIFFMRRMQAPMRPLFLIALAAVWLGTGMPHPRMVMFLMGMIVFEWREHYVSPWLGGLALIATLAGYLYLFDDGGAASTAVLAVGMPIFVLSTLHGTFYTTTVMLFLGQISYSYYLIHALVIASFARFVMPKVEPVIGKAAAMPMVFGATVVVGWLLFVTIEKPLLKVPTRWTLVHKLKALVVAPRRVL